MVATLGDDAPASSTMQKWSAEFRRGRQSLENDPKSGHRTTETTEENIERVHYMMIDDRRSTITYTHIHTPMNGIYIILQ